VRMNTAKQNHALSEKSTRHEGLYIFYPDCCCCFGIANFFI
jgi:hypothetical protein